jgi:co-chaperonin GroES (HSP10)
MIGAKLFNEKKGVNIPFIYGCVTTGDEWLFMKYENDILIDQKKYYLSELSDLLGIFQQIIGIYKEVLN